MNEHMIENLPDLLFAELCKHKYGVNRGIYNVVDRWLYEKGFVAIAKRRRLILYFFQKLGPCCEKHADGRPRFGKNGLALRLQGFLEQSAIGH